MGFLLGPLNLGPESSGTCLPSVRKPNRLHFRVFGFVHRTNWFRIGTKGSSKAHHLLGNLPIPQLFILGGPRAKMKLQGGNASL